MKISNFHEMLSIKRQIERAFIFLVWISFFFLFSLFFLKFRVLHLEIIQAVQNVVQMVVLINELLEVVVMIFLGSLPKRGETLSSDFDP